MIIPDSPEKTVLSSTATYLGARNLVILDYGRHKVVAGDTTGQFEHYSPEADFYALVERDRGMQVEVVVPGNQLPAGSWIATCDPRSRAWLTNHYQVTVVLAPNAWCDVAHITAVKSASFPQ